MAMCAAEEERGVLEQSGVHEEVGDHGGAR